MSAVSMKLTPASATLSSILWDSASSVCFPNVPVPRIIRETVMPVWPNFVNCIGTPGKKRVPFGEFNDDDNH
jgi:hypothetical protein